MKTSHSLLISIAILSVSLGLFPLTSTAQTGAVRARVTEAVDMQNLVTLRGNVHPLARPEFDQVVAPDDLPMERMLLVLQRGADQETVLRKLLDDQQVKSSAQFHQWLTPEQFGQQFGPADSDLHAVTGWLASQGFVVTKVSAGRTVIEFSGTAGLVRQVLGTEIHKFRVNGQDHWANTRDPQIPAALKLVVSGFASLNNFPRKPTYRNLGTFRRAKATGKVEPQFTLPVTCSDGTSGCIIFLVGPSDFATIYNIAPLWTAGTTGKGQTIAVVGETNINPTDVADFRQMFGLPTNPPNIILNGPDPGITSTGEESEADLDVEWSGAVAEDATVDFVISETTETTAGIDLSAVYIIDNNLAPVMSESYGGCEAGLGQGGNAFYSAMWEQAAAQGITVLQSSGDAGSAGCDSAQLGEVAAQYGLAVNGFASTPFNVAVGGTDLSYNQSNYTNYWLTTNNSPSQSSAKSYIPETTWNFSCAASGSLTGCTPPPNSTYLSEGAYLAAGGGGPSSCINPTYTSSYPGFICSGGYAKPSWQGSTGVPGVPQDGARDVPDVSLLADSYIICQMDVNSLGGGSSTSCDLDSAYPDLDFQVVGGTSAAVQAFAGIMALVNQAHGRQGNANYILYPLAVANSCASAAAAVSNTACIFYDTQTGNNSVICQGGSLNCNETTVGDYGTMVYGSSNAIAYATNAGYDLATGLGSVNVANLVNHWTSVTFAPTTATLTPNPSSTPVPVTLTHGQPFDFTVGVAPTSGSGTPAGDVSLIPQSNSQTSIPTTGIGPFTLSSGSVSISTLMLPGGSYNVTAHYAGNGTYAASDSSPVAVKVSTEGSQTKVGIVSCEYVPGTNLLASPLNCTPGVTNAAYGSSYLMLRFDVINTTDNGQTCVSSTTGLIAYPCPTGTVTATLNGNAPTDSGNPADNAPGSYVLNSQSSAEDQYIQFAGGTYNVVAKYGGDQSYTASTSAALPVTITQAQTSTTITGVPSTATAGTQLTVTATLSTASGGIAPTGTMQLLNNGSPLGGPVNISGSAANSSADASAQASLTTTLATGSLSLAVKYSGDAYYATSTSSATSLAVTDFGVSANPTAVTISAPGQQGTTTISVSSQNGFTGTVNLSVASGCPTGASCTLASSSVNPTAASPAADVLTINTTGSASAPPALERRVPPNYRLPVGLLGLLAGMLALALLLSSPAMRRRPAALLFATTLLVVGVWAACGGGGGGGGGTPPPPAAPAVSISPGSLTFASQSMGTTSAAQSVTLTNSGNASLTISTVTIGGTNSGDFAKSADTCSGATVAASGTCSISVTFAPTASGSRSASVSIADNATGSPQTVSLAGTATSSPTPPGTYPIVVNGVSGSDTHSLTVNVTVQ